MAFTENLASRTYISGSAFSQFTFVTLASDGQIDNTAAGLRTDGVAMAAATGAGKAIQVAYDGRVTVLVGAAGSIAQGAAIAVDAAGKAITAASTKVIVGYALEAGAAGQVITIELNRGQTPA